MKSKYNQNNTKMNKQMKLIINKVNKIIFHFII